MSSDFSYIILTAVILTNSILLSKAQHHQDFLNDVRHIEARNTRYHLDETREAVTKCRDVTALE